MVAVSFIGGGNRSTRRKPISEVANDNWKRLKLFKTEYLVKKKPKTKDLENAEIYLTVLFGQAHLWVKLKKKNNYIK